MTAPASAGAVMSLYVVVNLTKPRRNLLSKMPKKIFFVCIYNNFLDNPRKMC